MTEEAVATPIKPEELGTGTQVNGEVTYLAPYGAIISISPDLDALLHISQIGRTDFRNIEEVFSVGDAVEAYVLKVDGANRIALTMDKPPALPWSKIKKGEAQVVGNDVTWASFHRFAGTGILVVGGVNPSDVTSYTQEREEGVNIAQRPLLVHEAEE